MIDPPTDIGRAVSMKLIKLIVAWYRNEKQWQKDMADHFGH